MINRDILRVAEQVAYYLNIDDLCLLILAVEDAPIMLVQALERYEQQIREHDEREAYRPPIPKELIL